MSETPPKPEPVPGEPPDAQPDSAIQPSLTELALNANHELESSVAKSSNTAFNLGCSIALLPVAAVVLLAFLFSSGNFVTAAIWLLLGILGATGFALYAANRAKNNSSAATYHRSIQPMIERQLHTLDATPENFDQAAEEALRSDALLLRFLPFQTAGNTKNKPHPSEENDAGL